jgi:prepilin-type N-terminal cleavage/methylation domain-containing protein
MPSGGGDIKNMQFLMRTRALPRRPRGFTLIEIAVALLVIAILLSALLVPLTTQVVQRKTSDTQKALEDIKEALLGFAVSNGRLPCPATTTSNGIESPPGGGVCTNPSGVYMGFVPAATLGLSATDSQGYAIDAWGQRIRYAVTTANASAFTSANGMRNTGLASLLPNLYVCASSPGTGIYTACPAATVLTDSAPAVIYSLGPNWVTCPTSTGIDMTKCGADEAANLNGDPVFVYHVRSGSNAPNGEFDDIVTWLSENVLYNRMVSAGQLP